MKRMMYLLLWISTWSISCSEADVEQDINGPRSEAIEKTLTFSVYIEPSIELMSTKAGVSNVNDLIVFLFDHNNILTEILTNPSGNTVKKTVKCIPNQFYTIVYLVNCYDSYEWNTHLVPQTTRISDLFIINVDTYNASGGKLIAYGQEKRILTIEDSSVPITVNLTPRWTRIKLCLPANENQTNKKYRLSYQCPITNGITLDGLRYQYVDGYVSTISDFVRMDANTFFAYVAPPNPAILYSVRIAVSALNMAGNLIEEKIIPTDSMIPIFGGKSYTIYQTTPFKNVP
ncbi:MAG: hypothetical protein RSA98_06965 [Odoribacter sp.]